ncbi:MAG: hypothetical protein CVV44_07960 [Spirochaetae bacterium HGW-Spirochaetae-1]|nr:MAG: hypothetical protein CVV44_07960 [Spirochaetae bacterium HGW-Spirochaetae-1]
MKNLPLNELFVNPGLVRKNIKELFEGKVNREIADTLNITSNTINAHITNIYNKCGVNTKLALMNLMKQYELV